MSADEAPKVCLTIAGLDPSGGAGILADVKTFTAFECFAVAAITSITFQNSRGVFGAVHQSAETIRGQVEPVFVDLDVASIKTGMMPTTEIIRETARLLKVNDVRNVVVDPIIRSTSGYDLIDDMALESLVTELFPVALIVTPNIPEAERITGTKIVDEADIAVAAEILRSKGVRNVLIKGGHFEIDGDTSRDFLFTGDKLTVLVGERIRMVAMRGTGCSLSAAIAANLALGIELTEAVRIAKHFVAQAFRTASSHS